MNKCFLYKNGKIVVSDDKENIYGPYIYSDNLERKLKIENEIESNNNDISENAKISDYLKSKIIRDDKYSKMFLCAGVGASLLNYLLSFVYDIRNIYISNNFDYNNLKIGNILVDYNTYVGIKCALIILPVPLIVSLFHYALKKADQEELQFIKKIITDYKIENGALLDEKNNLDVNNGVVTNRYNDYDLVDLVNGKVKNVKKRNCRFEK
jgi:hypothetical protein